MNINEVIKNELDFIEQYEKSSIMINTTAKHSIDFSVLPRRVIEARALSSFMINKPEILQQLLEYFDGKVDEIFIDIELKQEINLYGIAQQYVKNSELITVKPNDTTLESCDLLIRNHFNDNLTDKNVIVIGTGNLASKIALRMSERQCNVYIKGRSSEKEAKIIEGLNMILPNYNSKIKSYDCLEKEQKADLIISFLSGLFEEEGLLKPHVTHNTFMIDGGINNFSSDFVNEMLNSDVNITRLDTRIALEYQLLSTSDYIKSFFSEVYGQREMNGIMVASGGYIGKEGTVIVDNIQQPNQIVGIADGSGGVKKNEQLREKDRHSIQTIKEAISTIG